MSTSIERAARRFVPAAILAALLLVVLPDAAHACPVCFDASDENRKAFFVTAVFLSLFPLGMVAGTGLWLRKRSREVHGPAEDHGTDGTDQRD